MTNKLREMSYTDLDIDLMLAKREGNKVQVDQIIEELERRKLEVIENNKKINNAMCEVYPDKNYSVDEQVQNYVFQLQNIYDERFRILAFVSLSTFSLLVIVKEFMGYDISNLLWFLMFGILIYFSIILRIHNMQDINCTMCGNKMDEKNVYVNKHKECSFYICQSCKTYAFSGYVFD